VLADTVDGLRFGFVRRLELLRQDVLSIFQRGCIDWRFAA